jgi:hypothetical protein
MRDRLISIRVVAAVVVGMLSFVSISAAQFDVGSATLGDELLNKPTPRTPDGHPDLTGMYLNRTINRLLRLPDGSTVYAHSGDPERSGARAPRLFGDTKYAQVPDYKPEYLAEVKKLGEFSVDNINPADPALACKPVGIPRAKIRAHTGALQIIQHPKYIGLLYESAPGPTFRIIYTDGRKHPERVDSSFFGHSIGHWEGDTLVVDTVGFNDETALNTPVNAGPYAGWLLIHSDQMHVVERWTRKGDVLIWEGTIDDPVMFNKPWVVQPDVVTLAFPNQELIPQMCIVHDAKHIAEQLESLGFGKVDYERLGDIHYRPEGNWQRQKTYMGGPEREGF